MSTLIHLMKKDRCRFAIMPYNAIQIVTSFNALCFFFSAFASIIHHYVMFAGNILFGC